MSSSSKLSSDEKQAQEQAQKQDSLQPCSKQQSSLQKGSQHDNTLSSAACANSALKPCFGVVALSNDLKPSAEQCPGRKNIRDNGSTEDVLPAKIANAYSVIETLTAEDSFEDLELCFESSASPAVNEGSDSSPVPNPPGAFRVYSSDQDGRRDSDPYSSRSLMRSEQFSESMRPKLRGSAQYDSQNPIEATLVEAREDLEITQSEATVTLRVAEVFHAKPMEKKNLKKLMCGWKGKLIAIIAILFFVGLIVTIALLATDDLGQGGDENNDNDEQTTLAPSIKSTANWTRVPVIGEVPEYVVTSLEDLSSPQSQAVIWLQDDPLIALYPSRLAIRRFVLATWFFSTNGYLWSDTSNWLSYEHDVCDWVGVVCFMGELKELWLPNNGMAGTVPPEMALLTTLEIFNVSSNSLSGTIPTTLGKLQQLIRLDVRRNELTGGIPSEFGHLSSLIGLDVQSNQLSYLPTEIGNVGALEYLNLSRNHFAGSVPSEIGELNSLEYFNIEHNSFSGLYPHEVFLLGGLVHVDISHNSLTGDVAPVTFTSAQTWHTEFLDLSNNNFTGTLPIIGMPNIRRVNVGMNQITGELPWQMAMMRHLEELTLAGNRLVGPIPSGIGEIPSLKAVAFNTNDAEFDNNFSGTIPRQFCDAIEANSLRVSVNCDDVQCTCNCDCTNDLQ